MGRFAGFRLGTVRVCLYADKEELEGIAGVAIDRSVCPRTINLYYRPSGSATASADTDSQLTFHFRIHIPSQYPFRPPSFKWISRPAGPSGHSQFLGPNGDVSVPALSQWTPASSLANVLLALFPSAPLAAQCCRATSHLWQLEEGKLTPAAAVADPRVLHCLAEHLLLHEPKSAQALHLTCRAAASAVQQAVSKLSVTAQTVDIVHTVQAFSGLTQLKCTVCSLACQSIMQLDPSLGLMASLRSLAVIRCSVPLLLGPEGLFAALQALPHLEEFDFEPTSAMLWALYDNTGQEAFAGNPFNDEAVLQLPAEVPTPVPEEWSSIWRGIAEMKQLRSLTVTVPLYAMAYAHRDLAWHGWPAAARIVDHAFSPSCLSSMPALRHLTLDLQHGMMRAVRTDDFPMPARERPTVRESSCVWELPTCKLTSLSLSGVALGERQLNYRPETKEFWSSLEFLKIGHTAVAEDLQSMASKMLRGLACNVTSANVMTLDLPPGFARPGGPPEGALLSWWEGLMQDRF